MCPDALSLLGCIPSLLLLYVVITRYSPPCWLMTDDSTAQVTVRASTPCRRVLHWAVDDWVQVGVRSSACVCVRGDWKPRIGYRSSFRQKWRRNSNSMHCLSFPLRASALLCYEHSPRRPSGLRAPGPSTGRQYRRLSRAIPPSALPYPRWVLPCACVCACNTPHKSVLW